MVTISISMPGEVLSAADKMAAERFEGRSEFIRRLIMDERGRRADAYRQEYEDAQHKKAMENEELMFHKKNNQ